MNITSPTGSINSYTYSQENRTGPLTLFPVLVILDKREDEAKASPECPEFLLILTANQNRTRGDQHEEKQFAKHCYLTVHKAKKISLIKL
jgi:hypothetical protein